MLTSGVVREESDIDFSELTLGAGPGKMGGTVATHFVGMNLSESNDGEEEDEPIEAGECDRALADVVEQRADDHQNAPANVGTMLRAVKMLNCPPHCLGNNEKKRQKADAAKREHEIDETVLRLVQAPTGNQGDALRRSV